MNNPLGISVGLNNWELLPQYAAAGIEVVEISLPGKPIDELREFACEAYALLKKSIQANQDCELIFVRFI